MGRHTLNQNFSVMHCERSEHCDLGYQHFGPCPPPESNLNTTPAVPDVLTRKRQPQVPDEIVDEES